VKILKKVILSIGVISIGLLLSMLFTACTSSSPRTYNNYIYNNINFGSNRNASFKMGVQDACKTANGDYTKNHTLFNSNESYKIGWESGRLHCKGRK
jgi:hypothetical protein